MFQWYLVGAIELGWLMEPLNMEGWMQNVTGEAQGAAGPFPPSIPPAFARSYVDFTSLLQLLPQHNRSGESFLAGNLFPGHALQLAI